MSCIKGHGGDEFLKFQDIEEMSAQDLGFAFKEMEIMARYRKILLIVDTCQAETLFKYITSPNIVCIGSSKKSENSYAYLFNEELGLPLMDRFTYSLTDFFSQHVLPFYSKTKTQNSKLNSIRRGPTLQSFIDHLDTNFLFSHVNVYFGPENIWSDRTDRVLLADFFMQKMSFTSQSIYSTFYSHPSLRLDEVYRERELMVENNNVICEVRGCSRDQGQHETDSTILPIEEVSVKPIESDHYQLFFNPPKMGIKPDVNRYSIENLVGSSIFQDFILCAFIIVISFLFCRLFFTVHLLHPRSK